MCYNDLAKHMNYKEVLSLTDKKGIVFSNYISTCEIAFEKCKKEGYQPARVYGEYTENLNE